MYPKALLRIADEPAIALVLRRLATAGVRECVINLHHLGSMIEEEIGDGSNYGLTVEYSREATLLDVGGGIANALTLLGDQPFIVANADICSDYDYNNLSKACRTLGDNLAHMVLGANPPYHPKGDFGLRAGKVCAPTHTNFTYMGTAVYAPELFASIKPGTPAAMMPLWQQALAADRVTGEYYAGWWLDIGTPERLERARVKYDQQLSEQQSNDDRSTHDA